jgi:hypothetical protein
MWIQQQSPLGRVSADVDEVAEWPDRRLSGRRPALPRIYVWLLLGAAPWILLAAGLALWHALM